MAKIALMPPYQKFHGKVVAPDVPNGQVLFSTSKSGLCARAYTIPNNPLSANQVLIRGYHAASAAGYAALSAANALLWTTAAQGITKHDILGNAYELSGIGLYCMVNDYRQMQGQALSSTVPALTAPTNPSGTVTCTYSGGVLTIGFTHLALANTDWIVTRITPDLGNTARQARANELTNPCAAYSSLFDHPSTGVVSAALTLTQVTLSVGKHIGIEFRALNAGYYPGGYRFLRNVEITAP